MTDTQIHTHTHTHTYIYIYILQKYKFTRTFLHTNMFLRIIQPESLHHKVVQVFSMF